MKLDWKRVFRTAIQTGTGAAVSAITAISADYSTKETIITALVGFVSSVLIAVLMNIKAQTEEEK